jgi:uncharacterized protein YwqG
MDLPSAMETIRSSALSHRADALIAALRPSIRIRTIRDPSVLDEPVSKFGGRPSLPQRAAWPMWESTAYHQWSIASLERQMTKGDPVFLAGLIEAHRQATAKNPSALQFLAQIRLEDLGPLGIGVGLPEQGTLLFFYDVANDAPGFLPQSRGSSRVILTAEPVAAVAPPQAAVTEFAPCRLTFEVEHTLPDDVRDAAGNGRLHDWREGDRYHELRRRLAGGPPYHRLCGHPEEVQNGLFVTCQLATNGIEAGTPEAHATPDARALAAGADDWRLLLQLDTDDDGPGWMWGDSGTLYFCIREDDLRGRRFDRIWCDEQCC